MDLETSLHRRWSGTQDLTEAVQLGLNSMPGVDERIISDYALGKGFKKPFLVKSGEIIYFANPRLVEGWLWWKKIKVVHIKKTVWEAFLDNPSSLNGKPEMKVLNGILEPRP